MLNVVREVEQGFHEIGTGTYQMPYQSNSNSCIYESSNAAIEYENEEGCLARFKEVFEPTSV